MAEALARELDMLKEKGISGVEINSVETATGDDPMGYKACDWLSDERMKMLQVTLDGTAQRGITCDISMGSGLGLRRGVSGKSRADSADGPGHPDSPGARENNHPPQ